MASAVAAYVITEAAARPAVVQFLLNYGFLIVPIVTTLLSLLVRSAVAGLCCCYCGFGCRVRTMLVLFVFVAAVGIATLVFAALIPFWESDGGA
jgi:hypothetical protein